MWKKVSDLKEGGLIKVGNKPCVVVWVGEGLHTCYLCFTFQERLPSSFNCTTTMLVPKDMCFFVLRET